MLTNPNWNVHTNYAVNDVFKPVAANQLVSTIPYDYVITQAMLDWGVAKASDSNGIDIAKVLKKGDTGSTTDITPKKRISVMLDCDTDSTMTLNFRNLVGSPWFVEGQGTNTLDIYPKAPFIFTGRSGPTYIYSGYKNFVAIPDTVQQATLYVGVFTCTSNIPWSTGSFIYEAVRGNNVPSGASVVHTAWMTNKVPVSVSDISDLPSLTADMLILHSGDMIQDQVDNTTFTAIQEKLGSNIVPYLVTSYSEGLNHFCPLIAIYPGCIPVFRDETSKRNLRLEYDSTQHVYKWNIVNDFKFHDLIPFPGAGVTQLDVYNMLVENITAYGLPKLAYNPSGSQTFLVPGTSYLKLSNNSYNFYWTYSSGSTTNTLWMNEQGTWAID